MFKLQHLFVTLLVAICHLVLVSGAAMDWQGTWSDPVWGGNIYICVTTVNNVNYAMASMSDIGYLKGTIDATTNVFSGNYYIQGREQRRGAFTLTMLTTTGTLTASSSLKDAGNVAAYSHTATGYTKTSSVQPTNLQCLRTDDKYVGGDYQMYLTGSFVQVVPWSPASKMVGYDDGVTSRRSYSYDWGNNVYDGYVVGAKFENGIVSTESWYENTYMGIELTIMKNSTAFYVQWVWIDTSSHFVYANLKSQPEGTVAFGTNLKLMTSPGYAGYDKWNCYQLQAASELKSCLANNNAKTTNTTSVTNVSNTTMNTEKANLAFGIVNCLLIISAITVIVKMKQQVLHVSGDTQNAMQQQKL
jgi:hypothetical protein